jgi:glutamyl/glutaminyl-tRNA synthetase
LLHGGSLLAAFGSWLLAHHAQGRWLVRVEDLDPPREVDGAARAQLEMLEILGLHSDAPILWQHARDAAYGAALKQLLEAGLAFECHCSRSDLAATGGIHHRCVARPKRADFAVRLRVGGDSIVTFHDGLQGAQRQDVHADIGDFVLRRADGSASFFFTNAVDDALSDVTHVLRGDDHLANTPRQLLILLALQLPAPQYGHLALITGDDGAPLSKRNGAVGLRALREQGILPEAIANHLFRLGHSTAVEGLLALEQMASAFDTAHLQRSPAHFQMSQLLGWQREAVHRLDPARASQWLGSRLPAALEDIQRERFIAAVLPNVVLPDDALPWVQVVFGPQPQLDEEAAAAVASADRKLFTSAAAAAEGNDFSAISAAAKAATGLRGPALFKPLRAALTGRLSGPELGPLLRAMPDGTARQRLARFA